MQDVGTRKIFETMFDLKNRFRKNHKHFEICT